MFKIRHFLIASKTSYYMHVKVDCVFLSMRLKLRQNPQQLLLFIISLSHTAPTVACVSVLGLDE